MSIEFRRIQEIDIKWHEASTRLGTELDWKSACVTLVACCVIISRARLVGSGSGTQSASAAMAESKVIGFRKSCRYMKSWCQYYSLYINIIASWYSYKYHRNPSNTNEGRQFMRHLWKSTSPHGNVCWDLKAVEKSIRLIQHTGDLLCFCSFRCLAVFLHTSCHGTTAQTCRGELTVASEELQCRDCILSQPRPDNADVTMKALQATDRLCGCHLAHVASIWPPQDLQDCILHSDPSANFQAS